MDSNSRRAFSLDSRTVWVEQQLVRDVLMPRDNLPLGPGEYQSRLPERHVSTPKLGKFRGPADHFLSFKSDLRIATPSNKSSGPYSHQSGENLNESPPKINSYNHSPAAREFSTIFHDHDVRQPLDPNKRFCETPGPYLSQDPPLRSVTHDGVNNISKIYFGPNDLPFGERNEYRTALPQYEVKYDSKYVKPTAPLGSFDRNKRVIKIGTTSYYDQHDAPLVTRSPKKGGVGEHLSVYEMRCSLVPLPKLKTRKPEQLLFDASSYCTAKTKEPLTLHPNAINKVASVHLFDGLVAIPRKHVSVGFSSPVRHSKNF